MLKLLSDSPTCNEGIEEMAATTDRLRKLVTENIEVDGKTLDIPADLDVSLTEAGVSSTDMVALAKLVANEFNVTFTPDDCAGLDNLKKVAAFVDSRVE